MTIAKDRVVSIDYILKGKDGEVIDRSEGEPLTYLHGNQNIIPGLEQHLEGKKSGDAVNCVIAPADGYGEVDKELVFSVSPSDFAEPDKIEVGMQFQAQQADGVHIVTVVDVAKDKITVDANHPLAGKELHFSVTVRDVREASAEELEHGHTHSAGGCGCGGECGDDCGCEDGECSDEGCGGGCGCH